MPSVCLVAQGVGHTDAERDVPADDAVATPEPVLDVEQVHRAALALDQAGALAVQLGHHLVGVAAEEERVGVVPVGGDDLVCLLVEREKSGGDGFLATVEMEIPADLPCRKPRCAASSKKRMVFIFR